MGKMQREKGARVEREIAAYLSEELGVAVKRQLGQARDGGDDLRITNRTGFEMYSLEVKARRSFGVSKFLRQCEAANEGKNIVPIAVLREDGDTRPMALLRLEDLVHLIREAL